MRDFDWFETGIKAVVLVATASLAAMLALGAYHVALEVLFGGTR